MKAPERSATQQDGKARLIGATPEAARQPAVAEITLAFDDNRHASAVLGQYDQNIARVERRLGVSAHANGNRITLKGSPENCESARRVLETLYARVKLGQHVTPGDVDGAIEESALQGSLFPSEPETGRSQFDHIGTRKKGLVRARNAAQDQYIRALAPRRI